SRKDSSIAPMKRSSELRRGLAIGLTGGIACGKSAAGDFMHEQGAAVLDADRVAHDLLAKGAPVYNQVIARFGPSILGPGGDIDRSKLGRMIFEDEAGRAALNELTHPAVMAEIKSWVERTRRTGRDAVVLIPLLFEINAVEGWDAIVCVAADEAVALKRLKERGLTEHDAKRRMAAQLPIEEKAKRSGFVIRNNGSMEALKKETERVYASIREKEKKAHV
ncbi:MAG TPA: dephospho-CoA kinase, partial [Kiritimatiellia bacterium]